MPKYYAVARGFNPGIYSNWNDAKAQVDKFPNAKHKKFNTMEEATEFIQTHTSGLAGTNRSGLSRDPVARIGYAVAREVPQQPNVLSSSARNMRIVYCDGACLNNGRSGSIAGIGIHWPNAADDNRYQDSSERLPGPPTNNRAELYAIIRCLEADPRPDLPLLIKTDSRYAIDCIQNFSIGWERGGWLKSDGTMIKNLLMIRYILHLIRQRKGSVNFEHVRGHQGITGNEIADRLAVRAARFSPSCHPDEIESLESKWSFAVDSILSPF